MAKFVEFFTGTKKEQVIPPVSGEHPIVAALEKADFAAAQRYLSEGANLDHVKDENGKSLLRTFSILTKDIPAAEWLIRAGADVNIEQGIPLRNAIMGMEIKLMRLLLLYGARYNTALSSAEQREDIRVRIKGEEFLRVFDQTIAEMEAVRQCTGEAELAERLNIPRKAAEKYLENANFFLKENIPPQAEKHLNKALPLAEHAYTQTPSPETATLYAQALTTKASLLNLDKAHNHSAEIILLTQKAGELTKSLTKRPRPPSDEVKESATSTPAALRHLPRGHNGYTQLVAADKGAAAEHLL